jgi:2-keto-3-deoxy-L-rhamnonate aldolase RhmA
VGDTQIQYENRFKQGLVARRRQFGAWLTMGSATSTEIFAHAGYDWLLVDMEHSPNDLLQIFDHLRAARGGSDVIVRVPWNDSVMVKRVLDAGTQSILFPFVQSAEEARAAVAATRYPPDGIRGVAGTTRASDYGRRANYHAHAAEQIAVVVQIETTESLARIEEIAGVDGVDGVFIGPNDLAASMGHLGNQAHPDVRAALLDGARRIHAVGKASGTLAYAPNEVPSPFHEGFDFLGVTFDAGSLVRVSREAVAEYSRLRDIA